MPEDSKPLQSPSLIIVPKDLEKYTKIRTLEQDQKSLLLLYPRSMSFQRSL